MFCLPNLVSSSVSRGTPWSWRETPPPQAHKDRSFRTSWINKPATQWQVYSLVEGLAANARVRIGNDEENANPPYRLHGFVADYDAPIAEDSLRKQLVAFPYQPHSIERTLSGNLRLIWLFEKPLLLASAKYLTHFLEKSLEFFPADKLLPGFDKAAWTTFTRYYTNSGEWLPAPEAAPIPAERIRGWDLQIASKFNWVKEGGVEIPFEILRSALTEKYPRFAGWGDFGLGAMGETFWVPDSTSANSAKVFETGIYTFSAHASKRFYTWADLLESDFVRNYTADNLGRAVEGVYFDGKNYWLKLNTGLWAAREKSDMREFLRLSRNVSPKCDKRTGRSDLDMAMEHVRNNQSVAGAGKLVFRPSGPVMVEGQLILNTSTLRVLTPAEVYTEWGVEFPFLASVLDNIWSSPEQKPHFLGWLSIFYTSCWRLDPVSGLNVFIAGPVGVGKSFLNHRIIGGLMGGSAQADEFLLDKDSFGGELFAVAHWMVDDAVFSANPKVRQQFGEKVKKMNANRVHRYHEKYRMPSTIQWQGRIVTTCNDDPQSILAIPDLSGNIIDKLMLLRTAKTLPFKWPPQAEKILAKELPHFGRWLIEHYDDFFNDSARFGQVPYHEPSLVLTSERSSYTWTFLEILEAWKAHHFAVRVGDDCWTGTAFELHKEILKDPLAGAAMRSYDVAAVGRQLASLINKGHRIEFSDKGRTRIWKIFRQDTDK